MKVQVQQSALRRLKADVVVLFVVQDEAARRTFFNELKKLLGKGLDRLLKLGPFTGKDGEILEIIPERGVSSGRLFVMGLGEKSKLTPERWRRCSSAATRRARGLKAKTVAFSLEHARGLTDAGSMTAEELASCCTEGALLGLYRYDRFITEENDKKNTITTIILADADQNVVKRMKKAVAEARTVCDAVITARDLANAPGNVLYPETLAKYIQDSASTHGFRVTIWDLSRIKQAGFGGLTAVGSGSDHPPRFVILEHNAGRQDLDTIVLVGKGITFDAGGISIKPAAGMGEMKMDMSGAAAVVGTLEAASRLHLPIHLVGLIPAAENLLGGAAMRPGDVITHYGGKTSEVDNTDAEGRLVLADALAFASTYSPRLVIDLATLTGACVVALGHHATGMMGTAEGAMDQLRTAGEQTYERVWQLPLFEEYEKLIKSEIADVKNTGGRWAGAITAALFLKKFVGNQPWIHLDIAGTAMMEEELPYAPKGGTGVGVRLLIQFLKGWQSRKP